MTDETPEEPPTHFLDPRIPLRWKVFVFLVYAVPIASGIWLIVYAGDLGAALGPSLAILSELPYLSGVFYALGFGLLWFAGVPLQRILRGKRADGEDG